MGPTKGTGYWVRVEQTQVPGIVRIVPRVFGDARGYFYEAFQSVRYAEAGLPGRYVQDNVSSSAPGTLRGLHLQHPFGQGKLISVLQGEVWDVGVDVRVGSPTFGHHTAHRLSADNREQLYIPPGYAHGFAVLGQRAVVHYKCTAPYHPEAELCIAWDDPTLAIEWPLDEPTLSEKDRGGARISELAPGRLPHFADDPTGVSAGDGTDAGAD